MKESPEKKAPPSRVVTFRVPPHVHERLVAAAGGVPLSEWVRTRVELALVRAEQPDEPPPRQPDYEKASTPPAKRKVKRIVGRRVESVAVCAHPVGRRIGDQCAECGATVKGGRR